MLARNTTLRFFNLSGNLITDEGLTAISRALMSNRASSLLDLQVSGPWLCRVSCVVCRVSCVVCRVSCVVCRVCRVSCVSCVVCVVCVVCLTKMRTARRC
jgi:hypothetical protein